MGFRDTSAAHARLAALRTRLLAWLTDAAYPLWAERGIDPANGGFIESLAQNGAPLPHPRRARVHPRQIYAFAQAPALGWNGDVRRIVLRGAAYFTDHYRRPDGLFRTLAGTDGTPLDERAALYDQAFALLGFAAAAAALDARAEFEQQALALRSAIETGLRAPNGAFYSTDAHAGPFESNPHMHLLEACLAWIETGVDPGWTEWARQIVRLATQRFIRPASGALAESFTPDWSPWPGVAGRIVEPGHQFEWAWLLLRAQGHGLGSLMPVAERLMAIGEGAGVVNRVAINALTDDFAAHDPNARFWPQTERLKVALLAARLTGRDPYWQMAAAAAESFLPYLATPLPGLWRDVQLPNGELVDAPAPASTFYHLVGAIGALHDAVAAAGGNTGA